MPDVSWNNGTAPVRPRGLSLGGKIAIGCGTAVLCFVVLMGALFVWGLRTVGKAMDRTWAELRQDADGLRSDASASALYRANPGLSEDYPTEAAFLEAAARWRPRLGPIAPQRPGLKDLFGSGKGNEFSFKTNYSDGRKLTWMRLRMSTGATLVVELDGEKLTDIHVD